MLNVLKLKGKMVESGKTVEIISKEIGIDAATFYRKLKDNSFKIAEADRIATVLSLTGEEASAIFLSQYVAQNERKCL